MPLTKTTESLPMCLTVSSSSTQVLPLAALMLAPPPEINPVQKEPLLHEMKRYFANEVPSLYFKVIGKLIVTCEADCL